jgi:2-polyprenyl-3-methyl-5-hydroxy-6-metoxy-1,4-benzoquinol methylase
MDISEQMEHIYQDIPLENIPWNISEPPELLVQAVATGQIKPCKVVDLGCGAGNYSVWLAEQKFDVTGIDISPRAIEHAKNLACRKGVTCRFIVADLLDDLKEYHGGFDFALDWEVLHHIFPEHRERYVQNVHTLLCPGSGYLSLCFSERDAAFGGEGKLRDTPLGTTLYFSSEDELWKLFNTVFEVLELSTVEIPGKYAPHMVNVAWLRRV